ncbi:N-acetylmuramoyl-L-alanine amidase [Bacillus sp. COPE52]|uniref:N-acetylmuramoyl-L-alanine amidase n=1 Tax=Bacillus sp. COPE52 TaxID=2233998 RepID=UPI000E108DCA|nr:N-acetylmuramoyl-L-alanine amidase [Bacillus sp. COPE52]AXK19117.1 N-acetylmuramoyl-L-alanine amidase [Bacillus sp. COPE52]
MEIKQMIVPEHRWGALCPNPMTPTEITFHETDNDAPAINERNNVANNSTGTSFHIAIDDKEAIQLIPFYRNAWHAGDGTNGRGNRHSIGIEICYNKSGGARYEKAVQNAIIVIRQLMKQFNIPIEKVKTHNERNGKNCPSRMIREGRVQWFKQMLVNGTNIEPPKPQPTPQPTPQGSWKSERGSFVLNTSIKLRTGANTSSSVIAVLASGETVNYDAYRIDQNGHVWIRQPRAGGTYGYLATGESANGRRVNYWGTFK